MKSINKKLNIRTVWLLSYLIIVLFLFLAIFVINHVYSKALNDTTESFNLYVFQKVSDSVSDVLSDFHTLHTTILRSDNVHSFFEKEGKNLFSSQATYDLLEDLVNYKDSTKRIELFFFYLKETDKVLSYQGLIDSKSYYDFHFSETGISYAQWKKQLIEHDKDKYLSMVYSDSSECYDSYAFMFKLPDYPQKATGVMISDKTHLISNVENMVWSSLCNIYVYDTFGNLVISTSKDAEDSILYLENDGSLNALDDEVVYKENIIVNNENWSVITSTNKSALNKEIMAVRIIILIVIAVSIAILILLIRVLLQMHFHPVKHVVELFGNIEEKDINYSNLYKNIDDMLRYNKELLHDNERQKEKMRETAVFQFLCGVLSEKEMLQFDISFEHNRFAVIMFTLDVIEALFASDMLMQNYERRYHLKFIINNIFGELFQNIGFKFFITEINDIFVGLLEVPQQTDVSLVEETAQKGTDFINEYFNINLKYTLSDVEDGAENVSDLYEQANEARRYQRSMNVQTAVTYKEISNLNEDDYIFSLFKEQKLIQCIKIGNYSEAQALIKQMFSQLQENTMPPSYISYVILDIVSTITKSSETVNGFENEMSIYQSVAMGEDVCLIEQNILNYLDVVCQYYKTQDVGSQIKSQQHVNQIIEYVQENFMDVNLNVSKVSEYFQLTPQYISKIFKDNTAMTLLDYINRLRVEKAQAYIREGRYTAQEISAMVGINNERTYYRLMKKYRT